MKYRVQTVEIEYFYHDYEVEADSESEARERVLEYRTAGFHEDTVTEIGFPEGSTEEVSIISVEQTGATP